MNHFVLLNNYVKLGLRNLTKNWIVSLINITGLAMAIGVVVTVFIFIDNQLSMDNFHTKGDRIYQITNYVKDDQGNILMGDSPILLGPQLVQDHQAVESFVRIEYSGGDVKYGSDVFREAISFVDPSYFEIFDFPMIYGDRKVLYDKKNIVISRAMAVKYFAHKDPVGKELSIKFKNNVVRRFEVGGVIDALPGNASFSHDLYLSIDHFFDLRFREHYDWSYLTDATFVLLKPGHSVTEIADSFDQYRALQNASDPGWIIESFKPFSLPELALNDYQIDSAVAHGAHPSAYITLTVIGGLLLLMACFNYMNISVSSATKRLKEIALRKVMGGIRRQIINQFLVENFVQVAVAIIVGIGLSFFVFLPGFNSVLPRELLFSFSSIPMAIGFFLALLVVIGLASGAYPAFYISCFQPISIFRGNQKFGSKGLFSKVLLGVQFFLAFVTIVGSFIFAENGYHLGQKDWGYDPEDIFSIRVENGSNLQLLKDRISDYPMVESVAASRGQIGRWNGITSYKYLDQSFRMVFYPADAIYAELMNLRLEEGHWLTDQDYLNGAIVNEKFVDKMGWEQPVNKQFVFDSIKYTVHGVVEDFHYSDFHEEIRPLAILGQKVDDGFHYLTVKAKPGSLEEVDEYVEGLWRELAADDYYERRFQSDIFDSFYRENDANISLMLSISVITIILGCLGLYGLMSFSIASRLKEFGVRKVLGARWQHLTKIAGKIYIWVILISFAVGAPLGFVLIDALIQSIYPDPKTVGFLPFSMAICIVIGTVVLTVLGQLRRASQVNPAEILKTE